MHQIYIRLLRKTIWEWSIRSQAPRNDGSNLRIGGLLYSSTQVQSASRLRDLILTTSQFSLLAFFSFSDSYSVISLIRQGTVISFDNEIKNNEICLQCRTRTHYFPLVKSYTNSHSIYIYNSHLNPNCSGF